MKIVILLRMDLTGLVHTLKERASNIYQLKGQYRILTITATVNAHSEENLSTRSNKIFCDPSMMPRIRKSVSDLKIGSTINIVFDSMREHDCPIFCAYISTDPMNTCYENNFIKDTNESSDELHYTELDITQQLIHLNSVKTIEWTKIKWKKQYKQKGKTFWNYRQENFKRKKNKLIWEIDYKNDVTISKWSCLAYKYSCETLDNWRESVMSV